MKLSPEDMRTFEQACADRGNRAAEQLVNVFGAASAAEIVAQLNEIPAPLHEELAKQVQEAINEQKRRIRKP